MSKDAKSSKKESGFRNFKDRKESGSARTTVKAVKTKSGVEGIRMLDPRDAKTWPQWSDEISSYVLANYFYLGNCFSTGYYKDFYVSKEYDNIVDEDGNEIELDASDKKLIQKERITQYVKEVNEFKKEKSKAMGVILQSISTESKHMLESHPDYVEEDYDPLAAFNILEQTHKHRLAYVSKSLKPSYIKAELSKCKQFPNESLIDFKNRFEDLVEQYEECTTSKVKIPKNEITMDFILKLDKRYIDFQKEIKRWSDTGDEDSIPKTLTDAVAKANLIVNENSIFRINNQKRDTYPAIFNTKTKEERGNKSNKADKKKSEKKKDAEEEKEKDKSNKL